MTHPVTAGLLSMRWSDLLRRFVTGIDLGRAGPGRATSALFLSLRDAFLVGVIVFQGLIVVSTVVCVDDVGPAVGLIALAVGLVVVAILVRADRCPTWVVVGGTYLGAWTSAVLSDSPDNVLTFNGNWQVLMANGMPAVFLRGAPAFLVHLVGCAGYSICTLLVHPEWGATIPRGQIVAGYSIMLAMRAGVALLAEIAARADERSERQEQEAEELAWVRRVSMETADQARTLHDTVINTLAVIAVGGLATQDRDLIRERCASDGATIDALLLGRDEESASRAPFGALRQTGLTIRRSGLDESTLLEALHALPTGVLEDLERAAFEVAQNAAKHSGVRVVHLHSSLDDGRVRIVLTDEGVGFEPNPEHFRGLAGSVLRRAERSGITVEITSRLGVGTSVVLLAPEPSTSQDGPIPDEVDVDEDLDAVVATVRRGASWLWALGVLAVGVVLEVTSQPGRLTPTYLTLILGFAAVILLWQAGHRSDRVQALARATVVAMSCLGFVLAAATSDFGRDEPVLWQVLSATGMTVMLWTRSGRSGITAVTAQVVAAAVIAAVVWPTSSGAVLVVLSGVGIATLFVLAWMRFDGALGSIGRRLSEDRRRILTTRVERRLREASAASRQRWRDAGLVRVRNVMAGIAAGTADPQDEAVRRRCGEEESYLRQVIQLSPDLVLMGPWLVRALESAHDRGVELVVRSGDQDAPDERVAEQLGRMILEVVERVPSAQAATVTLFGVSSHELRVTVVAPAGVLGGLATIPRDGSGSSEPVTLGSQDLLELAVPATQGSPATVPLGAF